MAVLVAFGVSREKRLWYLVRVSNIGGYQFLAIPLGEYWGTADVQDWVKRSEEEAALLSTTKISVTPNSTLAGR